MRRVRDYRRDHPDPEAYRDANIPERYWVATAEAIKAPSVRAWVESAVEHIKTWLGNGHGFYIHGNLNCGKSSLAAILGMDAVRRCERVLWLPVREVPGVRFRDTAQNEMLADRLSQVDLLILDDLGAEKYRLEGPAGAALEAVVREVYDRHRSVIFTSNVNWDHLPKTYDVAGGFLSVLARIVVSVAIENNQWPRGLEAAW